MADKSGDSILLADPCNSSPIAQETRRALGISINEWRWLSLNDKLDLIQYQRACSTAGSGPT